MDEAEALRRSKEAMNAAKDVLLDLYKRYPGQKEKIEALFKFGEAGAREQLDRLAIPKGIRPDVIEAYKRLADIAAQSPPDPKLMGRPGLPPGPIEHGLDSKGVQAKRSKIAQDALNALKRRRIAVRGGGALGILIIGGALIYQALNRSSDSNQSSQDSQTTASQAAADSSSARASETRNPAVSSQTTPPSNEQSNQGAADPLAPHSGNRDANQSSAPPQGRDERCSGSDTWHITYDYQNKLFDSRGKVLSSEHKISGGDGNLVDISDKQLWISNFPPAEKDCCGILSVATLGTYQCACTVESNWSCGPVHRKIRASINVLANKTMSGTAQVEKFMTSEPSLCPSFPKEVYLDQTITYKISGRIVKDCMEE